ncbi:MAG: sulfatase-like hydrolase/transferase, partial [Planctomycetota bacterium]|nr:sulfatase-like hydrolase/transferase [Planctomycetota bacterium]
MLILLWWQPLKLKARLAAGLGYINLLVIVLLALSVGRVDLTQADEFDLAEAPELVIPAVDGEGSVGHPDVLLISVDTLRADTTIDPLIPTPNIDKLKAVSYFSDYAVAPSPVTLPSHISMVTGELPTVHAAYTNLGRMPVASVTLGEAFQQAGYSTVAVAS